MVQKRAKCQTNTFTRTLLVLIQNSIVLQTRTNSRSGPRTSLGPVTLTVGVVLGPV